MNPEVPLLDAKERRAAAYLAYWEHQPLSRSRKPVDENMPIFRRAHWGALATFHVIDTRQYRADQLRRRAAPPAGTPSGYCNDQLEPDAPGDGRRAAALALRGPRRAADGQRLERDRQPGRLRAAGDRRRGRAKRFGAGQLGRLRRRPPAAARAHQGSATCATSSSSPATSTSTRSATCPPDYDSATSRRRRSRRSSSARRSRSGGQRTGRAPVPPIRTTRTTCGRTVAPRLRPGRGRTPRRGGRTSASSRRRAARQPRRGRRRAGRSSTTRRARVPVPAV